MNEVVSSQNRGNAAFEFEVQTYASAKGLAHANRNAGKGPTNTAINWNPTCLQKLEASKYASIAFYTLVFDVT